MVRRTVLITGCSSGGIGDELAQVFHRRGHHVFATARDLSKVEHLREMGMEVFQLDVTDSTSIRSCAESIIRITGGRLDILVNNAGVAHSMPLLDADMDEARKVFETNYFGVLATIQVFAPMLIQAKGRILNISSIAQFSPVPFLGIYNSSKAAIGMLSDNLRIEMKPFGVKVICVITGGIVSNLDSNTITGSLPPTSFYRSGKAYLENVMHGSISRRYVSDVHSYAERVVEGALTRTPSSRIFAGDKATTMWMISTFGWHTLLDWVFPTMYRLSRFEKELKNQERKDS